MAMEVCDVQKIANLWAASLPSGCEADITGLKWENAQCTSSHDKFVGEEETELIYQERFPYDYPVGSTEASSTFAETKTRTTSSRFTVSRALKLGAATKVTVGFPSLLGGNLQLKGELDLTKTRETTVESSESWTCSKTYPVCPQTVAVLKVLVHVRPFQKDFTVCGEITGLVKAVKKDSTKVKGEIQIEDLFKKMKRFGTNGFEELKESGKLTGVVFKVTGKIEGKRGIFHEVIVRQEKMNRNRGNSEEKQVKQDGVTDVDQNAASPSNSDELVVPSVPNGATAAVSPPTVDISRLEISQPTGSETEAVQPQDETDSTSVTAYDSPPTLATDKVPVIEEIGSVCRDELAKLLDKRHDVGLSFWLHLADKLGVTEEMLKRIQSCFRNMCSPTDHLVDHLTISQPDLTIKGFLDALEKINRLDLKKTIIVNIAEIPGVDCDTKFRELSKVPFGKWSEITMNLDVSRTSGYKDLAEALGVPKEDYEQFGSDPRSNPAKTVLNRYRTKNPWFSVRELKKIFTRMNHNSIFELLSNFEDDATIETVYNNIDVMPKMTKELNKRGSWKDLAGQLGFKSEDVDYLEPLTEDRRPTLCLFDHLTQLRPRQVTLESVIISLADMERYDALSVIQRSGKFLDGYVDRVLLDNGYKSTVGLKSQQTSDS